MFVHVDQEGTKYPEDGFLFLGGRIFVVFLVPWNFYSGSGNTSFSKPVASENTRLFIGFCPKDPDGSLVGGIVEDKRLQSIGCFGKVKIGRTDACTDVSPRLIPRYAPLVNAALGTLGLQIRGLSVQRPSVSSSLVSSNSVEEDIREIIQYLQHRIKQRCLRIVENMPKFATQKSLVMQMLSTTSSIAFSLKPRHCSNHKHYETGTNVEPKFWATFVNSLKLIAVMEVLVESNCLQIDVVDQILQDAKESFCLYVTLAHNQLTVQKSIVDLYNRLVSAYEILIYELMLYETRRIVSEALEKAEQKNDPS
ncbi:MAG: hypothetical protein NZO16_05325 [Deltaproteobacteria bacterium]|nr:hypothetical protein [Deltaproteobacteria bacterium]